MPEQRIAVLRKIAVMVATLDPQQALTEYERVAIELAREMLGALDEIERLRAQLGRVWSATE